MRGMRNERAEERRQKGGRCGYVRCMMMSVRDRWQVRGKMRASCGHVWCMRLWEGRVGGGASEAVRQEKGDLMAAVREGNSLKNTGT